MHTLHPITIPEADYLYTQPSQISNAGNGLYTAIPIYKNEIIACFTGEILSNEQANERALKNENAYFITLLNGKTMDSMHTPCFAKYANDANGSNSSVFKNNAQISITENNKIVIIATKKIKAYEEIFCSYGKNYWKNR